MAKKKETTTAKPKAKKASSTKKEEPKIKPKISDFLDKRIKDIGHSKEDSADELTIKFDNGYNVVIKGNYSFSVEER